MYPVILLKWSRLRFPVMQDLEFSQCIILHNDDCQVAVSYFVVILLKWSRLRFPVMQDLEFSQETPVEFNDHVKPRYQIIMPAKFLFIKGIRLYISMDKTCFMYFSDHFNALNTNLECIHRRQRNDFLHHPLLKLRIRFRNRPHRDAEVSATCYLSLPENEDCEKAWA
ncbi:hypothetical protein T12_11263 [Trichinella patagoniensis]|uniref:Uncharacterized protein n=1 Tax=Trichinella patagoniensis TaxID=990121 RepID=A0A0V0ZA11_9BILA|nr:hypothetical protein T12_11263 [Trichinella patagoniensis]